jgi:hypothetical protein
MALAVVAELDHSIIMTQETQVPMVDMGQREPMALARMAKLLLKVEPQLERLT